MTASRAGLRALLWVAVPVLIIAAIRPWTTRPIGGTKPAAFEAVTFAASTWPRLEREASESATDVAELALAAPTGRARFVKGSGAVTAIDRLSRVGVMRVQVAGATPRMVAIQIGPVIRGTALRDAAGFIQFSDFVNQFDYAGAANALNDHALRTVIGRLPIDSLQGRTITFIGAIAKGTPAADGVIDLVPVRLEPAESTAR